MKKRRILVTLESRATYGYSKNVMNVMSSYDNLELVTLVTGMHLMPELGHSIEIIKRDGFEVAAEVEFYGLNDKPKLWSEALGDGIKGFAKSYDKLKPDLVLLSGDRIETFGCCAAAAYMGIPIAHIQAGDKSGHIDDSARHAIGKFSHIHLASCEDSAERLRRMGEQEFRIYNVGAPQLDDMVSKNFVCDNVIVDDENCQLSEPYILVVQHPVMAEKKEARYQIESTLEACLKFNMLTYIIYPNSDSGYQEIIAAIKEKGSEAKVKILKNTERETYLKLLANCSVLVGNSSSGILEAPSFKIPVVNVGNRQRGRPQALNILNSNYLSIDVEDKIRFALNNQDYRKKLMETVNPYGDGRSSKRICDILSRIEIDNKLLDKECTY